MVQQKSADDTDKTRTDRVGRIPDRLLGRELRRLDPMRHETDARRHAHTLEITVQHPKRTDDINQSHRRFSVSIKHIHERIHGRAEADREVGQC